MIVEDVVIFFQQELALFEDEARVNREVRNLSYLEENYLWACVMHCSNFHV